jgi:hypothetical protein
MVIDALRDAGSRRRSVAQSASESLHLSVCRFTARGINVRLTLDTAPQVRRRYFNRVTEQEQLNVHRPEARPHPIMDLGDEDAYGPAGAYWVPAYRQLFALSGERLLIIGFAVHGVGAGKAQIAAERLARAALERPKRGGDTSKDQDLPSAALRLSIIAPVEGELVRGSRVTVYGTVTGRNARVRISGRPANVRGGIFARTLALNQGKNLITVSAFGEPAQRSQKTITIKRGRSARQIGAAFARRRPGVVPDLLGERLDVAETILRYAGLRYRRVKIAAGKVVAKAWAVCLTRPPPETRIRRRKRVVLLIDRADIYRVSGTACAQE